MEPCGTFFIIDHELTIPLILTYCFLSLLKHSWHEGIEHIPYDNVEVYQVI